MYDPDDLSVEQAALECFRELIGDCDAWSAICEQPVGEDARNKITIDPDAGPWDGAEYTPDQLADILAEIQLFPSEEETLFATDTGTGLPPRESGVFTMVIRRYARASEIENRDEVNNLSGEASLLRGFRSRVGQLLAEMKVKADTRNKPHPFDARIVSKPTYNGRAEEAAQHRYLWCIAAIDWGLSPES